MVVARVEVTDRLPVRAPSAAPPPPPPLPDSPPALVRDAVKRCLYLFEPFRGEFDLEDACSEGGMAVARAADGFRAGRATWSTFVNLVVKRRLLDIHKAFDRRAKREARAAVGRDAAAAVVRWVDLSDADTAADALPGGLGGDADTVEDWARRVYRQA